MNTSWRGTKLSVANQNKYLIKLQKYIDKDAYLKFKRRKDHYSCMGRTAGSHKYFVVFGRNISLAHAKQMLEKYL